jgi:predicted DNA-binding transcriptional regulator AlpA
VVVDRVFITAKEASETFCITPATWYTWIQKGIAPRPFKIGNRSLWRVSEINQMVEGGVFDATAS